MQPFRSTARVWIIGMVFGLLVIGVSNTLIRAQPAPSYTVSGSGVVDPNAKTTEVTCNLSDDRKSFTMQWKNISDRPVDVQTFVLTDRSVDPDDRKFIGPGPLFEGTPREFEMQLLPSMFSSKQADGYMALPDYLRIEVYVCDMEVNGVNNQSNAHRLEHAFILWWPPERE
jgi:hypothetical protein